MLLTTWNSVYLSDFSGSIKPTYLPEDYPAYFSFYFDTSGRRTCYVAPERFISSEQPEATADPGPASEKFVRASLTPGTAGTDAIAAAADTGDGHFLNGLRHCRAVPRGHAAV